MASGLLPESALSPQYHVAEGLLDTGWTGTFGELAVAFGYTNRNGITAWKITDSYAARHLGTDVWKRVTRKRGG